MMVTDILKFQILSEFVGMEFPSLRENDRK